MEYGIDFMSKYTTLQIRWMLVWKGMNKKQQKRHRRKSPQGGWGMGSKEPIPKLILFIIGYNIRKLKYQKILGPYIGWNQYLTTLQEF